MTPLLPHLDLDDLSRLLQRIESDAHRAGWVTHGAGLNVFVLYDGADVVTAALLHNIMGGMGKAVRVGGRYCAQLMLPARIFDRVHRATGGPPWEFLRNFALNVAYAADADLPNDTPLPPGALDGLRALLSKSGIFGFAACYEAWQGQLRGPITAETRIKDQPGARECRRVMAVDALDRVHVVNRVRGDKPEVEMDAPIRGDLSTSLRILVDTAYDRLPPAGDQAAFAARYPTLNEARLAGRDVTQSTS